MGELMKKLGALGIGAFVELQKTSDEVVHDRVLHDFSPAVFNGGLALTRNEVRSEKSRAMFERLKDCADRINDQLGPHKASARSGSVERHRALAPCAPGNPGHLQVPRAVGGGASSRAPWLRTG